MKERNLSVEDLSLDQAWELRARYRAENREPLASWQELISAYAGEKFSDEDFECSNECSHNCSTCGRYHDDDPNCGGVEDFLSCGGDDDENAWGKDCNEWVKADYVDILGRPHYMRENKNGAGSFANPYDEDKAKRNISDLVWKIQNLLSDYDADLCVVNVNALCEYADELRKADEHLTRVQCGAY